jgi:hypothetical protein
MSAKRHALRLSSKHCSTCKDLRQLKSRIEVALRKTRNLYRAAWKNTEAGDLQTFEEELQQSSTARTFVCYAIDAHLANQHSRPPDASLAA